jgi:hypothetical protein
MLPTVLEAVLSAYADHTRVTRWVSREFVNGTMMSLPSNGDIHDVLGDDMRLRQQLLVFCAKYRVNMYVHEVVREKLVKHHGAASAYIKGAKSMVVLLYQSIWFVFMPPQGCMPSASIEAIVGTRMTVREKFVALQMLVRNPLLKLKCDKQQQTPTKHLMRCRWNSGVCPRRIVSDAI